MGHGLIIPFCSMVYGELIVTNFADLQAYFFHVNGTAVKDHIEFCTLENLENVAEDIDEIWKFLVLKSGLTQFETITTSVGGTTFIGYVED